ncbi:MAG: GNAT family N-acetyltransferase [Pseudomonadota bacterium]
MIEARYHDSVNVLQEMFAARGGASPASAPFERAEWFALLAQTGLVPLIATAQESDDMAALALTETAGRLEPLRNWYSFTWRQIAPDGEAGDRLLLAIASQLRNRTHRITLAPVPEEDGSASRLARTFAKAGWRVEVTQCDTNHILRPRGRSFADYWSTRPGALRSTLKRKGKKVDITLLDHFDAAAWASYETVYAASWKPAEGKPDMLQAFAQSEGLAGRLRLGLARHEGQAIAAQFWTVEGGIAYIHKLAHLESHKHLSAGTTLSAALFAHAIDTDKVSLIDFGTGDESYKRDWMEDTRPRYQIDCLDMRQPSAWLDLARLSLGRLRDAEVPALAPLPVDS